MTTYAELLDGVAQQIRAGAEPLRTDRLWTADQALEAIGDFHAVLDALASHTRRLLWPAQIRRVGLISHRTGLPPIERAAIALAAGIEDLVGAARPHPSQLAPATTSWRGAAMRLRAASDLVATHFNADGRPRTPDAAATDHRTLDTALVDLGHLSGTILAAEEPLALRALQAGVTKAVIIKHLPGLGHLADLAQDLSTAGGAVGQSGQARLTTLPQTWTPIRTDDPVSELSDRMHRLRQATFEITTEPGDSLATLRDVTTIGIAVHAHAAAFHGARPTTAADPAPIAQGAEALLRRGRAWQTLHRELAHFITLAPPDAAVRDDLVALSRLLPAVSPLAARTSSATLADPASRRIGASLNGAVATMTDLGDHSAAAFAELARAGALRLNARDLPRDLVSDDPELAADRLRGAIVRPPKPVVDAIQTEYRVVREHPVKHIAAAALRGPASTPAPSLHDTIGYTATG